MNNLNLKEILCIILAVFLLLCIFPMPYGYFVYIRLISTIVFGYLIYDFYQREEKIKCVIAALLFVLFQPIIKIPLGREIWVVIDIIVALLLVGEILWERKNKINN